MMQRKRKPGPATAEFHQLVEREMAKYPPPTRQRAIRSVSARHPELLARAQAEHCQDQKTAAAIASGQGAIHAAVPRQANQANQAKVAPVRKAAPAAPIKQAAATPTRQAAPLAEASVTVPVPVFGSGRWGHLDRWQRNALREKLRVELVQTRGVVDVDAAIEATHPGLLDY